MWVLATHKHTLCNTGERDSPWLIWKLKKVLEQNLMVMNSNASSLSEMSFFGLQSCDGCCLLDGMASWTWGEDELLIPFDACFVHKWLHLGNVTSLPATSSTAVKLESKLYLGDTEWDVLPRMLCIVQDVQRTCGYKRCVQCFCYCYWWYFVRVVVFVAIRIIVSDPKFSNSPGGISSLKGTNYI